MVSPRLPVAPALPGLAHLPAMPGRPPHAKRRDQPEQHPPQPACGFPPPADPDPVVDAVGRAGGAAVLGLPDLRRVGLLPLLLGWRRRLLPVGVGRLAVTRRRWLLPVVRVLLPCHRLPPFVTGGTVARLLNIKRQRGPARTLANPADADPAKPPRRLGARDESVGVQPQAPGTSYPWRSHTPGTGSRQACCAAPPCRPTRQAAARPRTQHAR